MLNCYQVLTRAILWYFVMWKGHITWGFVKHSGDPPALVEPSGHRRNRHSCIQVSFKKEVGVRVNDLVFWLTLWLSFENLWLTSVTYDYVTEVFRVDKVYEWHFFNKRKCVSTLKDLLWCFNEQTDSFLATPPSYPPLWWEMYFL